MNTKGFHNIEVSSKLDKTIDDAINKGKRDKMSLKFRKKVINGGVAVATIALSFTLGVNFSSSVARATADIPVIGYLSKLVKFSFNESISKGVQSNISKEVKLVKEDKGVKLTIDRLLADDKTLFIMYSIDSTSNGGDLSRAMPDNITLTDSNGKVIIDSKYRDNALQPDFVGKKGNFFFPSGSRNVKCNVSCLEKEGESNKTYGVVQVAIRDGGTIPDEINISFLEFTEAYNHNYSKEAYKEFVNKTGREARTINTNMTFNIKVDKSLKSVEPQVYKDIKFQASNVEFNIEHFKIYPTATELKLHLGKNKKTNKQAISILMLSGKNDEYIPYLVDEKCNKYMPNRRIVQPEDGDYNTLVFESVYFNEPKELYLVLNQIFYEDGNIDRLDGVKVRIK